MTDYSAYTSTRFAYDARREGVWRALCDYLARYHAADPVVLELGAAYCHFINNVRARERHAVDISPNLPQHAAPGVVTHVQSCTSLAQLPSGHFDLVFASNLFEHLTFAQLSDTLADTRRVLKRGGRLIVLQPNFKYCYRDYFDDYTHVQVFTHVSMRDRLGAAGFSVVAVHPRFLPFSMKSRLPKWPGLVSMYLRSPLKPFAGQMLIVAEPAG